MSFDRKSYARLYARRKVARKDAERNHGSRTCQHKLGAGLCGGFLEVTTDGNGRAVMRCPLCRLREAGLCRDCRRPVQGRVRSAIRCAECKRVASMQHSARYAKNHRTEVRRSATRYYKANAAIRKARNEYKKAWRKANRDKVRAQKRRSALRGMSAKAAQRHRERVKDSAPAQVLRLTPRTCLTCPTVVHGRVKKCVMCKAREALIAGDHPSLGRGKGWRNAA
jgi:hypothetical protein